VIARLDRLDEHRSIETAIKQDLWRADVAPARLQYEVITSAIARRVEQAGQCGKNVRVVHVEHAALSRTPRFGDQKARTHEARRIT
jgi:hypothetical protein